MLISGHWRVCEDGGVRPVVSGRVLAADGSWREVHFLVDTGADRTVFSAEVLVDLGLAASGSPVQLSGVGGQAASVPVDTSIRLQREDGTAVAFHGGFDAFTDQDALDMSVLGRNILNLFAAIVDRPRDVVCLIGQRHQYVIQTL